MRLTAALLAGMVIMATSGVWWINRQTERAAIEGTTGQSGDSLSSASELAQCPRELPTRRPAPTNPRCPSGPTSNAPTATRHSQNRREPTSMLAVALIQGSPASASTGQGSLSWSTQIVAKEWLQSRR